MAQSHSGELGGYTTNRRPLALAFSREFHTRAQVLASERATKGWARDKKSAFIAGDWNLR
jgi:predicted GIY-YIG superfamily endonuclease